MTDMRKMRSHPQFSYMLLLAVLCLNQHGAEKVDALLAAAAVLATPAGYLELCKRHDLPLHWGHPQVLGVFSHASHPNSKLTYKVGLHRALGRRIQSLRAKLLQRNTCTHKILIQCDAHVCGHRALRDTKSVCAFS